MGSRYARSIDTEPRYKRRKHRAVRVKFTPQDDRSYLVQNTFADNEPKIFRMVLMQACIDMMKGENAPEVAAWVRDSDDFEYCCQMALFEPGWARNKIKQFLMRECEANNRGYIH